MLVKNSKPVFICSGCKKQFTSSENFKQCEQCREKNKISHIKREKKYRPEFTKYELQVIDAALISLLNEYQAAKERDENKSIRSRLDSQEKTIRKLSAQVFKMIEGK